MIAQTNIKDKRFIDFPMWLQLLTLPWMYFVAICKILITIPMYIIAKCNGYLIKL